MGSSRVSSVVFAVSCLALLIAAAWLALDDDSPASPLLSALSIPVVIAALLWRLVPTVSTPARPADGQAQQPAKVEQPAQLPVALAAKVRRATEALDTGTASRRKRAATAGRHASGSPLADVDPDAVAQARAAIARAVSNCQMLRVQELQLNAAAKDLEAALKGAGVRPKDDSQWTRSAQVRTEMRGRRLAAERELGATLDDLLHAIDGTAAQRDEWAKQAKSRLSLKRARRTLTTTESQPAVLFADSTDLTQLRDAVGGVEARLDASADLEQMTHRLTGGLLSDSAAEPEGHP